MVLQLEDCTDILKVLCYDIDLLFFFDNPCRSGRGREDTLNVMKMISGYGEAKQEMH